MKEFDNIQFAIFNSFLFTLGLFHFSPLQKEMFKLFSTTTIIYIPVDNETRQQVSSIQEVKEFDEKMFLANSRGLVIDNESLENEAKAFLPKYTKRIISVDKFGEVKEGKRFPKRKSISCRKQARIAMRGIKKKKYQSAFRSRPRKY